MSRVKSSMHVVVTLLVVVAAAGCARERAKEEAKQRVFAPPPPDPMVVRAQEALDINAMPDEAVLRDRIHRMPFAEVTARLGPATFDGELQVVFRREARAVSSTETAHIKQGARDFSIDVVMQGGDEQHLVFHDGIFYVRHNFGQWRASRDPTDERVRWREQSWALWASVYDLFRERLSFVDNGFTTVAGRRGVRYNITATSAEGPDPVMPSELIWPGEGEDGRASDLRLARRAREWRSYTAVEAGAGSVVLDEEKAVPLEVSFEGTLRVRDSDAQPARLTIKLQGRLSKIGQDPAVKPPEAYVDEFVRRKIVTNPLSFLDGGGPAPKAAPPAAAAPAAAAPAAAAPAAPVPDPGQ